MTDEKRGGIRGGTTPLYKRVIYNSETGEFTIENTTKQVAGFINTARYHSLELAKQRAVREEAKRQRILAGSSAPADMMYVVVWCVQEEDENANA